MSDSNLNKRNKGVDDPSSTADVMRLEIICKALETLGRQVQVCKLKRRIRATFPFPMGLSDAL